MATVEKLTTRDRMCHVFSKAHNEDPGGSAPTWKRCLVIELAEPWQGEVAETKHFPSMVSEVLRRSEQRGFPTRLQCIRPDEEYSVEGHTRVMLASLTGGFVGSYERDEFVVPSDDVGPLVTALLERPEELDRFEPHRQDISQIRDMLVCTHGAHDVCCGSVGYPIYDVLRNGYARQLNGSLRVWQVSHLGGNRLAPNMFDLPEGRYWARLTDGALESLVHRNGPASALIPYYRGWAALDSPFEQMAEREVLMREGWDWVKGRVSTQVVVAPGGHKAEVRIDFTGPNGANRGSYEATVERTGTVPTLPCLTTEADGEVDQYAVTRLEKVR